MIQERSSKVIVFFSLAYYPAFGGAERQLKLLCERWARQGQDIWILTRSMPGEPREEVVNGVRLVRLNIWWLPGLPWLLLPIAALLYLFPRRNQIHSLWCMMFNVTAGAAVLCGQILRRPVVIRSSASGSGGNIRVMESAPAGRGRISYLLGRSQAIIVLNQEMIQELEPYRIPPQRIHLIPNGVDTDVFKPADPDRRKAVRREFGFTDEDAISLFVGRLEHQKNLFNLLKAWSEIAKRHSQARLLLVGEGSQENELRSTISQLGFSDHVRLMKNQAHILNLYQSADLFVLPSWFEGLSNALLEAMACGMPVLASRVPGNLDVLREPDLGVLIDPGLPESWVEPWSQLLSHPQLRIRLGSKARQWVIDQFSVRKTLEAYQALHQSLS